MCAAVFRPRQDLGSGEAITYEATYIACRERVPVLRQILAIIYSRYGREEVKILDIAL
ncbi:hypothetical protein BDV93DRAFT_518522 [Ceratobasidium sp. AG-I]|nr:hypothetical protein BDV93DRAFT_518522 [Ceratobasidium sp. AG-I]